MIIEEYNNSRKSDISTIDKFIKLIDEILVVFIHQCYKIVVYLNKST